MPTESQQIMDSKNEMRSKGVTDSYEIKVIDKKGKKKLVN